MNDTWIAACCLIRNLPLATLNLKDFRDFADHDGLVVIGSGPRKRTYGISARLTRVLRRLTLPGTFAR